VKGDETAALKSAPEQARYGETVSSDMRLALLRGINVGGKSSLPMADLRRVLNEAGFEDVVTYIQSGNVIFRSSQNPSDLEAQIEEVLATELDMPIKVAVRSHEQLAKSVADAPDLFTPSKDTYHCDALFVRSPLSVDQLMGVVELREGVDQAWSGDGVAYFARRSDQRTKSKLSKLVGRPEYKLITVRNWNTVTKLLAMLDEAAANQR